jgi:uncharacterized protein (DUF1684 family)
MNLMAEDWKKSLERKRERKDEAFADRRRSPLTEEERDSFDGLSYYPPDDSYRFETRLHEHDEKETITVGTSTGGEREYLRWGEFRVEIDGEDVVVQAYKSDAEDDRLWIPFRDETSGEKTYGAGRYIDLEEETHEKNGVWVLDFNEAYNPTCAYSERYECPLPPTENWLEVEIEAGERRYR